MTHPGVFIVGDFNPDRLGASYRRAFLALGQTVDGFDLARARQFLSRAARNRVVHRLSRHNLAMRRRWSRGLNARLLDAASASSTHVVLLINGEWIMPETVRRLKRIGKRVVIFHADNPFPPHYNNRPETLETAREADIYLTWSERLVDRLRAAGVRFAAFLPFGWDPAVFPHQGSALQGGWPGVIFIGGWDREREQFLDEVAADVPLRIYGPTYWGSRTRAASAARRCWMGSSVTGEAAARLVRDAAIALNILRTQHTVDGEPDGVIMRHFEVPGAGGFLLSTRSGGATRLFPEGETAAYFSGVCECIEACRRYLRADGERRRIVERSHQEVASRHTYTARARDILSLAVQLG